MWEDGELPPSGQRASASDEELSPGTHCSSRGQSFLAWRQSAQQCLLSGKVMARQPTGAPEMRRHTLAQLCLIPTIETWASGSTFLSLPHMLFPVLGTLALDSPLQADFLFST